MRETTGITINGKMYLWPEEAWYLVNKGSVGGQVEARADVAAFYSHMRRDGLFLTRSANLIESLSHTYPEITYKRLKTSESA